MKHPVDVPCGKRASGNRFAGWSANLTATGPEGSGFKFKQIQKYRDGMIRPQRVAGCGDFRHALGVPVSFSFDGRSGKRTGSGSDIPGDLLSDREALELLRSYYRDARKPAQTVSSNWPGSLARR